MDQDTKEAFERLHQFVTKITKNELPKKVVVQIGTMWTITTEKK